MTDNRKRAPSQAFKHRQRAYVVKVREDTKFPAHAKLMCFVVAEHWNEDSGEAVISTHTIAKEAGISQTNVRKMLKHRRLGDHLRVEIGDTSRRCNRYWPIEHTGAQSEDGATEHTGAQSGAQEQAATEHFQVPIEHFSHGTEHTGAPNLSNHKYNHSAPKAARGPEIAERDSNVTEQDLDDDLDILQQVYPEDKIGDRNEARAALGRALACGCNVLEIVGTIQQLEEPAIATLPVLPAYLGNIGITANAIGTYSGGGVTLTPMSSG